jgi:hypothetical protein
MVVVCCREGGGKGEAVKAAAGGGLEGLWAGGEGGRQLLQASLGGKRA